MGIVKFDGKSNFALKLPNGGKIQYISNYLQQDDIDKLFNETINLDWIQEQYEFYEKVGNVPRLMLSQGNGNILYKLKNTPWSPEVLKIKDRIEKEFDTIFEYAHFNLYRNGDDTISWHSDNETVYPDSVFSISIGQVRKFQLRPINETKITHEILLNSGSLLILDYDAIKRSYKHHVPREKSATEKRINITFREH